MDCNKENTKSEITMKIIKNLFRCIGCLLMTGGLFYLLLLCLEVKSYRHFIFVSHNVAALGDTTCVKADISFNISNTDRGNSTSVKFLPKASGRRDGVLTPQYHTIDDISLLSGLKIDQISAGARNAGILLDSITDLYTVVNLETARDLSTSYHEEISSEDGVITLCREHLMGDDGFRVTHASLIECVLNYTVEKEDKFMTNSLFHYNNQRFIDKSYYLLTSQGKESEISHKESLFNLTKWIAKCLEPCDITREEHFFVVHSEAIDTLAIEFKFDEKVDVSPLEREPSVEDYQKMRYNDFTTYGDPKYEVESKYLYGNVTKKTGNLRIGYLQQKGRENKLSFWVKYVSSEKIQWFRLFFLTTFLGFFLTESILSLFKFVSVFIESLKMSKR